MDRRGINVEENDYEKVRTQRRLYEKNKLIGESARYATLP